MKYELHNWTGKDGSIHYFVSEEKDSYSKYGFNWHIQEQIFSGIKEECENKIKELEEASK